MSPLSPHAYAQPSLTVSPPLGHTESLPWVSYSPAHAIVELTLELAGIFCLFGKVLRPAFKKQTEIILFFGGGGAFI